MELYEAIFETMETNTTNAGRGWINDLTKKAVSHYHTITTF